MLPWGPGRRQRTTTISDRFFLGGVGSLRGFRTCSVGPVDARRQHHAPAAPDTPASSAPTPQVRQGSWQHSGIGDAFSCDHRAYRVRDHL